MSYGQVGDGSRINRTSPVQIKAGTNFDEISAGTDHSLAIDEKGNLWGWGSSNKGQVGNGTTDVIITPVQIFKMD